MDRLLRLNDVGDHRSGLYRRRLALTEVLGESGGVPTCAPTRMTPFSCRNNAP